MADISVGQATHGESERTEAQSTAKGDEIVNEQTGSTSLLAQHQAQYAMSQRKRQYSRK